jgi:hypothetical protein
VSAPSTTCADLFTTCAPSRTFTTSASIQIIG